jgi:hypothetical protein
MTLAEARSNKLKWAAEVTDSGNGSLVQDAGVSTPTWSADRPSIAKQRSREHLEGFELKGICLDAEGIPRSGCRDKANFNFLDLGIVVCIFQYEGLKLR